ncbi:hypothetical protein BKA64DRAFT_124229 [Cadophora sp. MPI-SDFR-AT-0126]|nr:hypothetical protein BKA64DRAFT_124229 [Leotiomycetes sp. MPI-SDFR-AT-0126]
MRMSPVGMWMYWLSRTLSCFACLVTTMDGNIISWSCSCCPSTAPYNTTRQSAIHQCNALFWYSSQQLTVLSDRDRRVELRVQCVLWHLPVWRWLRGQATSRSTRVLYLS